MRGRRELVPGPDGPFSGRQAARIVGVNYRVVALWASTGLIGPSSTEVVQRGRWREYSFEDLVGLKVAATLYQQGIGTRKLRRLVKQLPKAALLHPLAHHRLVVSGDDVILVEDEEKLWSMLHKPGQGVLGFVLDLEEIHRELNAEVKNFKAELKRRADRRRSQKQTAGKTRPRKEAKKLAS